VLELCPLVLHASHHPPDRFDVMDDCSTLCTHAMTAGGTLKCFIGHQLFERLPDLIAAFSAGNGDGLSLIRCPPILDSGRQVTPPAARAHPA